MLYIIIASTPSRIGKRTSVNVACVGDTIEYFGSFFCREDGFHDGRYPVAVDYTAYVMTNPPYYAGLNCFDVSSSGGKFILDKSQTATRTA